VGYSFEFKVAAYNRNGTEGAMSNVVSVTVGGGSTPTPTYSLDGVWENTGSTGGVNGTPGTVAMQIYFSGSSGSLYRADNSPASLDAMNKGFYAVGSQMYRNIKNTGNNTWSGQYYLMLVRTSTPDIAYTCQWFNCTFTLSSNGQTLTIVTTWSYENSSGTLTTTWKRK
jgi:hypothetical protein